MQINWDEVKFRASSWGNLLTEPQTKAAKEAGELSITCQKELIKIYNLLKYGRKKDIVTKQMEKGILCEQYAIDLYCKVEGKLYFKNEEPLENEWFTGHPDIYSGDNILNAEEVDDIKNSWELDTFTPKLIEEVDKGYECQLNVYYDLCNCKGGNLVYTLVSAPPMIVEAEKYRLLRSMDVISEESPEFKKIAAHLENLMIFEDIDYRERVIKKPVPRNEELIQKMKDKVPIMRAWLKNFHEKHMNLYPKY